MPSPHRHPLLWKEPLSCKPAWERGRVQKASQREELRGWGSDTDRTQVPGRLPWHLTAGDLCPRCATGVHLAWPPLQAPKDSGLRTQSALSLPRPPALPPLSGLWGAGKELAP